ncbi:DNA-directed RNA polymerase, subunit 2 [Kipferlia bialata]|uniref:DNA-directed RNA polymerase n=1 Tax=Kipferlia bialata TaxID=797122 RepID=A0A391NIM4_9EUKA|nr:DNA-directed RNA polymerase, subunit 2 [Kipferlia bialata]|eukprot:g1301.t1
MSEADVPADAGSFVEEPENVEEGFEADSVEEISQETAERLERSQRVCSLIASEFDVHEPVCGPEMSTTETNPNYHRDFTSTNLPFYPNGATDPMRRLVRPHVESFNFFLREGVQNVLTHLEPVVVVTPQGSVAISVEDLEIGTPSHKGRKIYPSECREGGLSYNAPMRMNVSWNVHGEEHSVSVPAGNMTMMLRSANCHLRNLQPTELELHGEDSREAGGYFIHNGNERLLRMVILPRRHYPMGMDRSAYK